MHFEIAGPDGPVLQQFYRDLFGWKIDVQSEEMGNYGSASANEGASVAACFLQLRLCRRAAMLPSMCRLTTFKRRWIRWSAWVGASSFHRWR